MSTTPDYEALSEALVLYSYLLRALDRGAQDTMNNATRDDYDDAYTQLLRTQNLNDEDSIPADPGFEANSPHATEAHVLALRTAVQSLTAALRVMDKKRKEQEERDDKAETLLGFVASQELSSTVLHQVMLRFAEYRDLALRE